MARSKNSVEKLIARGRLLPVTAKGVATMTQPDPANPKADVEVEVPCEYLMGWRSRGGEMLALKDPVLLQDEDALPGIIAACRKKHPPKIKVRGM